MKLLTLVFALFPLTSFAQSVPQMSYKCGPASLKSALDAGPTSGKISKIQSLEIPGLSQDGFIVKMIVDGASELDKQTQTTVETYKFKEAKSGTMFELSGDPDNKYQFDAVFLEFGQIQATTIGPMPEGTYKLKISMAFVDSNTYFANPSPMAVKKVVFNCNVTVKY